MMMMMIIIIIIITPIVSNVYPIKDVFKPFVYPFLIFTYSHPLNPYPANV